MADTRNIGRALSYLLRHGAEKEGVAMGKDGFVQVSKLLKHRRLDGADEKLIQEIVTSCKKQRFSLENRKSGLYIRANQGHSLNVQVKMKKIQNIHELPNGEKCIHGTTFQAWNKIKTVGLSKMSRQHIHFACGEFDDTNAISGMRNTSEVLIYMDVKKMIANNIPLFLSSNNVILSGGINGFITPDYFLFVVNSKTKAIIHPR
jgi:2'-phosphotransferase